MRTCVSIFSFSKGVSFISFLISLLHVSHLRAAFPFLEAATARISARRSGSGALTLGPP